MPFCKFFFQKPQHIYIVEDNPENASAKAKIHTKPSFLSFLGDKCLIFWGKEGERTVRDQEEKEASQGRNINQSPPRSLAQRCRDALGSVEVTSQDRPDQALGHTEESLMKGCPLGNTHSRHVASEMCQWVLAGDKKMQILLYSGSESA